MVISNISSFNLISKFPLYFSTIFLILCNPKPLPLPLVENLAFVKEGIVFSSKLFTLLATLIICLLFSNTVCIFILAFSHLLAASIALFNKLLNIIVNSLSSNGMFSKSFSILCLQLILFFSA